MRQLRKFSLKYLFIRLSAILIFFTVTCKVQAQRVPLSEIGRPLTNAADTIKPRPLQPGQLPVTTTPADSLQFRGTDTLPSRVDTFSLKLSGDTLNAPVKYYALDSAVVMINAKKIYLYGNTKTEYEDITLTAPKVEIDQQAQLLSAFNRKDSTGTVLDEAKFSQGEQGFTSDTIRYNFKTQRGFTINTITESGEMFVHGAVVKRATQEVTYVKEGIFTTCNLDEPHFAFKANRLKMINKKLAISGPVHPEFEGVPLPVYLPFGYFPLSQGRRSGMLQPTFTTNDQFGLGLEGLGYYKVVNNYWDVKVYGNIYSYGGWAAFVAPSYRKRYRYNGSFNFGLQNTKRNFKGDPDYYSANNYTLTWVHAVDNRARPGTLFSANVNASSTSYNRNVPNNPNLNFQNQMGSSISYSKTWVDKPYNLTVAANHNQNNQTGLVNIMLPDLGFTVATIYPFQKKDFAGSRKWYEQLGVAYNGAFRNQVSFYDSAFRLRNLIDTLQWGAQHNIPITLSLPPILNGAIVVSPSVSYSQVWIAQKFRMKWDPNAKKLDTTITKGFFVDHQASVGLSLNTAIYGTYQFKKSRVVAIRHVIRPSLGISYRPDLSKQHFYTDTINASGYTARFSEFQGALFSGYGEGRSGGLSFQLDNNLQMKWRSKKDTAVKKINLIDGYGLTTSYNFLADSMKLSPIQFYFRTNLFEKININASATMSPYQTDSLGRDIGKYAWEDGKFSPGRITSGSISMSATFKSKPKDEEKEKQRQEEMDQQLNDPTVAADRQRLLEYMRQNPAEFVDFNIPWQVMLSYALYFREQFKSDYSGFERIISSNLNFNGSFNLTPKWNFSVNGYFDFDTKKLQTFGMSISRDMHCWQMSINVLPVGLYRSFSFSISPKSGILQGLRINRNRSFYSGF